MNQESKSAVKPITPPQSIPVFNCRVIVSPGETPGSFTATAAELAGLTVSAVSMREAMQKLHGVAKDNAKVVEDVVLAAQAGAKAFGEKVLHNTTMNTEAVFDAAQAIARARSLPEAARLQADFMQQQFAIAGAQTKELFELSAKVAHQTMESMKDAATRSFEQIKR